MSSELQRNAAIEAARLRRAQSADFRAVKTEWFIDQVCDYVREPMRTRVRLATELLKNRVIVNISRPVTKTVVVGKQGRNAKGQFTAKKSRTVVTNRSKPGEFPKADTTLLMKTIFSDYTEPTPGDFRGHVGTPLDYGLILELRLQRSFLVRTFYEQYPKIMRILSGPIT